VEVPPVPDVLAPDEIAQRISGLPGWSVDGSSIVKQFEFDGGFMGSIGFVNRLAEAAEAADHHPNLAISWNTVTVTLSTHSKGGITEKDFAMAAQAEKLATG
jgi:4a-hydroxytetrahydrobiopterin dehydratase